MTDELFKVAEDSVRGGFFLLSGTAISTVILAIASIVIARLLGPDLYGQYTLALVAPTLLFLFTDLGINSGITRFTAALRSQGEAGRVAKIIQYGLMVKALTGMIIFFVTYVFADQFASFLIQRPELSIYIKLASVSVLFQVLFTTASAAFVGLDKTEYQALTTNIQSTVKAITSITLILLGLSVAGAVIGHVAGFFAAAGVAIPILLLINRKTPHIEENGSDFSDTLKSLMRYGLPIYVTIILTGLMPLYQSIILAAFTSNADIGNYKAASNFISLVGVVSVPITTILLPAFSRLQSSTKEKIIAFFKFSNKYTALVIIPLATLIITLSNEIVQVIYGSTYESAALFLAIYCIVYFLVGLGSLGLGSFFNGLGETKTTMILGLITFLTLLALSPILTRIYGVLGLIVAFLVATTAGTTYASYTARRKFKVEFDTPSLLRIYLISALSSILPLLILNFTKLHVVINVVIGGLLYVLVYITLAPLAKIVTISELQTVAHITQNNQLLKLITKPLLKYEQKIIDMTTNKERNMRLS